MATGRITAFYRSFNRIRQVAPTYTVGLTQDRLPTASRSVQPFFHSSPFYPTPKIVCALQCFFQLALQTPESTSYRLDLYPWLLDLTCTSQHPIPDDNQFIRFCV